MLRLLLSIMVLLNGPLALSLTPPAQQVMWLPKVYSFEPALTAWCRQFNLTASCRYQPSGSMLRETLHRYQAFECEAWGSWVVHAKLHVHVWEGQGTWMQGELPMLPASPVRPPVDFPFWFNQIQSRHPDVFVDAPSGQWCWYRPPNAQTSVLTYRVQPVKHGYGAKGCYYIAVHPPYHIYETTEQWACQALSNPPVLDPGQPGWGATRYEGWQPLTTQFRPEWGVYVLQDTTRHITTYNCRGDRLLRPQHFTDADNVWTDTEWNNPQLDQAALDAHWGAAQAYDFWWEVFGQRGWGSAFTDIFNFVHFDPEPNDQLGFENALWDGEQMVFGDGHQAPLTAVDIVAHEYAHGVIQHMVGLSGRGPSAELAEALADIWAVCVSQFAMRRPSQPWTAVRPDLAALWTIGEKCRSGGYRSLHQPSRKEQPDTYEGRYYQAAAVDPHHNSTVLGYWFYLLCQGGVGVNSAPAHSGGPQAYQVPALGMPRVASWVYAVQRYYLTPHAHLFDFCRASLAEVYFRHGPQSDAWKALEAAWKAVHVWVNDMGGVERQANEPTAILHCYPNPATDAIQLTLPFTGGYSFRLYDVQGRLAMQAHGSTAHAADVQKIDVSTLSAGVYFIELQGQNGRFQSVVVKR